MMLKLEVLRAGWEGKRKERKMDVKQERTTTSWNI
jgi:hypothetical protein